MSVMGRIILLSMVLTLFVVAEPSVYANSSASYGASSQTKKEIQALKRQLREQKQQLEGLRSVVEGLTATVNSASDGGARGIDGKLLEELGAMIDKINANYVSREELVKALKSPSTYKNTPKSLPPKGKKKTLAEHYKDGVRSFSKKRYSEAKRWFSLTDEKGYKTAASNYYLGEIAYYTKQYEDAIFHFKKSAGLNDSAGYIDILLLHTAISLERTNQKSQARAFYQNIIENYKGKKSASIAKKRLKSL